MINVSVPHFNIAQICQSGQCFRMLPLPSCQAEGALSRYQVFAESRYLVLTQQDQTCIFSCEEKEFETFWKDYFDLNRDYGACIRRIDPKDTYLSQAAAFGSGIRILRQDLWEMIVSFLISQQNHIARIRRCIENICQSYGTLLTTPAGFSYHAFPSPQALACQEEDALMACNLGYRSKYVVRAAKSVAEGVTDLDQIRRLPYDKARQELLKLYGVGEKVADCICLFALHHWEAFPVDTHIRQALSRHYPHGFPSQYQDIQGVLQQYIFYYELHRQPPLG